MTNSAAAANRRPRAQAADSTQTGTVKESAAKSSSLRLQDGLDYDLLPTLAGFWIRRLQISVLKSYDEHLGDLQIRPVEAAALILLANNKDINQNVLAAALGTDQSTMVGISTRLENREWIERRRLANDRRYQVLNLTAAGRQVAATVKKRLTAHNKNVLKDLSEAERATFFSLVSTLVV